MIDLRAERQGGLNRRAIVQWVTVFLLSVSGLLTVLTGIYFLFMPSGGYQGGRNPDYGKTFLFDREIWTNIHIWAGMIMVAVVLFHIALHWRWLLEMGRRSLAVIQGKRRPFNHKITTRLTVIGVVGLVFLGVAASGIYFFVLPEGRDSKYVEFLFSRSTWDLIHTWTGVAMIVGAALHLVQRRKWVARVTQGVGRSLIPLRRPAAGTVALQRVEEGGSL
jgi:hypothetical protein